MPNSLVSFLPAAASWSADSKGFFLPDYRLEAGRVPHLGDIHSARSDRSQIWTALNQYRQLPYTFIYLFSFFLLADV